VVDFNFKKFVAFYLQFKKNGAEIWMNTVFEDHRFDVEGFADDLIV